MRTLGAFIICLARYYENELEEKYPDHPCPINIEITQTMAMNDYDKGTKRSMGYLACYCAGRFTRSGFGITKEEFPDGRRLCKDWIEKFALSNGFLLGIVLTVSGANLVLTYILAAITKFEKRHSLTSELTSTTLKILIAQFINTVSAFLTCRLL